MQEILHGALGSKCLRKIFHYHTAIFYAKRLFYYAKRLFYYAKRQQSLCQSQSGPTMSILIWQGRCRAVFRTVRRPPVDPLFVVPGSIRIVHAFCGGNRWLPKRDNGSTRGNEPVAHGTKRLDFCGRFAYNRGRKRRCLQPFLEKVRGNEEQNHKQSQPQSMPFRKNESALYIFRL